MNTPRIYVAGHRGMVCSAIVRNLLALGHPTSHIITCTHDEIVASDLAQAKQHVLLKQHGFAVNVSVE